MSNIMPKTVFENYVKRGESVGVSREQTRQKLTQNGWNINDSGGRYLDTASRFGKGALGVAKAIVAPALHTTGALALKGLQGVDYLAQVAAGKTPQSLDE